MTAVARANAMKPHIVRRFAMRRRGFLPEILGALLVQDVIDRAGRNEDAHNNDVRLHHRG